MKTLVFLFGSLNRCAADPLPGGFSAVERAVSAAVQFPCVEKVVLCVPCRCPGMQDPAGCTVVECSAWTKAALLAEAAAQCAGYDHVYFAPADSPFLDVAAAGRLWQQHITYAAEYTFADGYPFGLFPEIAAAGIVPMLAKIAADNADERVARDTVFSILQKDINSFEIETDIAPADMRHLRLELVCGNKRTAAVCRNFLAAGITVTADTVFECITEHLPFIRTLPSFYYIQTAAGCPHSCPGCPYPHSPIAGKAVNMTPENFALLVRKAVDFSGEAVISPSLWGEPAGNPHTADFIRTVLSEPSASVLLETTGIGWPPHMIDDIADAVRSAAPRTNGHNPVEWVVSLDAIAPDFYEAAHPGANLHEATALTLRLMELFPGCVWPQMIRTKDNEAHLEDFYRYWKEKAGRVLIQKYDWFCGQLPDLKTADLSPLQRNVCWHIKRDMVILSDGSVPPCREYLDGTATCGNAFTDDFADIWAVNGRLYNEQCSGKYPGLCGKCDEYYTFNF